MVEIYLDNGNPFDTKVLKEKELFHKKKFTKIKSLSKII